VESDQERSVLAKAEELLSDLYGDLQTVPLDLLSLIQSYVPRMEESIERFKGRQISQRELEAHTLQIRISYVRDLTRLLATEPW
jgi:hypothetical protein